MTDRQVNQSIFGIEEEQEQGAEFDIAPLCWES